MELNLTAIKKMQIERDNPLVSFLQKLPLFEGMDALIIDSLVSGCSLREYPADNPILSEWEESNGEAYVILSGGADVFIAWEKVCTLSEGAIFGEYALICNEKRSATIRAASPMRCLVLGESHILQISDETNQFNDILTRRITENIEANRGMFWEE